MSDCRINKLSDAPMAYARSIYDGLLALVGLKDRPKNREDLERSQHCTNRVLEVCAFGVILSILVMTYQIVIEGKPVKRVLFGDLFKQNRKRQTKRR